MYFLLRFKTNCTSKTFFHHFIQFLYQLLSHIFANSHFLRAQFHHGTNTQLSAQVDRRTSKQTDARTWQTCENLKWTEAQRHSSKCSLRLKSFFLQHVTHTIALAIAHHVCFPLNQVVFDMHAQSCPAPTLPVRESIRWLSRLQSVRGDKLTVAEREWTQALARHRNELAFFGGGGCISVCSTMCHLGKYEQMEKQEHSKFLPRERWYPAVLSTPWLDDVNWQQKPDLTDDIPHKVMLFW